MKIQSRTSSIIALLLEAGRAIREIEKGTYTISSKSDSSPVTGADIRSDTIIREGLALIDAGVLVLSEEVPEMKAGGVGDFWLLDPLDGTKEFIAGNGEYAISLARVSEGRPVEGYIHAPVSGSTWFALSGKGAFRMLSPGSTPEKLPAVKPPPSLVLLKSRSHHSVREEDWLARARENFRVITRVQGSAIKFGVIASGAADLYVKMGNIYEWDIAAGDIIVNESGGRVLTFDGGKQISYTGERRTVPWFKACSARAAETGGLLF